MLKRYCPPLLCAFCLILTACSQPSIYEGIKYPRTENVEVFNSAADVRRPYKIMGHIAAYKYSMDIVRKNLMYDARRVGADAVIIKAYETTRGSDADRVLADAIKYDK